MSGSVTGDGGGGDTWFKEVSNRLRLHEKRLKYIYIFIIFKSGNVGDAD